LVGQRHRDAGDDAVGVAHRTSYTAGELLRTGRSDPDHQEPQTRQYTHEPMCHDHPPVDLRSPPSAADVFRESRHSRRSVTRTQRKRHICFTGMVLGATLAVVNLRPAAQSQAESLLTRGTTALHLFEYEQANELFRQARQLNPELALAYWGDAMTYNQTLWGHEDVEAGRQVLARLGRTAAAREAKAQT